MAAVPGKSGEVPRPPVPAVTHQPGLGALQELLHGSGRAQGRAGQERGRAARSALPRSAPRLPRAPLRCGAPAPPRPALAAAGADVSPCRKGRRGAPRSAHGAPGPGRAPCVRPREGTACSLTRIPDPRTGRAETRPTQGLQATGISRWLLRLAWAAVSQFPLHDPVTVFPALINPLCLVICSSWKLFWGTERIKLHLYHNPLKLDSKSSLKHLSRQII